MKRQKYDLYIGVAFTFIIIASTFLIYGFEGIFFLLLLCFQYNIAKSLWQKDSRVANTIALLLLPILLLCYVLPKTVKNTIQAIGNANDGK